MTFSQFWFFYGHYLGIITVAIVLFICLTRKLKKEGER